MKASRLLSFGDRIISSTSALNSCMCLANLMTPQQVVKITLCRKLKIIWVHRVSMCSEIRNASTLETSVRMLSWRSLQHFGPVLTKNFLTWQWQMSACKVWWIRSTFFRSVKKMNMIYGNWKFINRKCQLGISSPIATRYVEFKSWWATTLISTLVPVMICCSILVR